MLDYLECQVPTAGFIFSDFMIADTSLMSPFVNAGYAGYEINSTRWPVFADCIARVKSHPVVNKVLEAEAVLIRRR
jgi:glutathione S-transferase